MKGLIVKIFLILLLACMIFSAGSCKPKSAPEATYTDSLSIPDDTIVEVLKEAADKTYAEPETPVSDTLPKVVLKKEKPVSVNKPPKKNDCIGTPKPDCICTRQYDPVCGCNGKTYGNACEAGCDGIKQFTKGECK